MGSIYKITNIVNGKIYIGKTTGTPEKRWEDHKRDSIKGNTLLYNAMRKYGVENFIIETIELVNANMNLNAREIFWITELNSKNKDIGYNMTDGGDGGWINDQTGNRWKIKDTSKMGSHRGKTYEEIFKDPIKADERRKKNSGKNNYQCNYLITTPWGVFFTWTAAISYARDMKRNGVKNVITDGNTIKKYCTNNVLLNPEGRRTPKDWRGKYTKDLGFDFSYNI